MPLKYEMDSVDGLPEEVSKLYEKKEGKYVLTGIQGIVPKSKLDEFRETNIQLKKDLEKKAGELTSVSEALEEAKIQLEKSGKIDEETVNKLVEKRVSRFKSEANKTIESLKNENEVANQMIKNLVLDNEVSKLSSELKVLPTAVTDVMLRAKQTFIVENGQAIARDDKGEIIYGKDGVSPLSVKEWMKGLKESSPHLFEGSISGGIGGTRFGSVKDASKLTPLQKIKAGIS